MSTLAWILVGIGAYALAITWVLAVLTAARRQDEATAEELLRARPQWARVPWPRRREPSRGVEASSHWLAQRTADAQSALAVERIAVVLRDPDDARTWVVEACGGMPGLCGVQIRATAEAAVGLLVDATAESPPWCYSSAPVVIGNVHVGEVAVAARRVLRPREQEFLERFGRLLGGRVGTRASHSGAA